MAWNCGSVKIYYLFSNIVECDFYLDKYILLQSLIVSSCGDTTCTVMMFPHCMEDNAVCLYIVHVREMKKEGRKKQARPNKQQFKAKQHCKPLHMCISHVEFLYT